MNQSAENRVADALPNSWVYTFLPQKIWPYAQLARWDRPIGWWLLLWPCWWSLALVLGSFSNEGQTAFSIVTNLPVIAALFFLFWLGAVAMRGAGCTYNDFIDVEIDAKVERTASRPIPSGRVSRLQSAVFVLFQALVGFLCLVGMSAIVAPDFNTFAFFLGISSLVVVACYPFAKRITDWPQLVLGLAFSWGALMGWAVITQTLTSAPIALYLGCICWVIGYDTIYAHQDREDDALVGVRSTARLFGDKTKTALFILYGLTLALMAYAYYSAAASLPAYLGLLAGCGHMIWQLKALDIDNADNCLALFKSNKTFGWIVFAGLVASIFY